AVEQIAIARFGQQVGRARTLRDPRPEPAFWHAAFGFRDTGGRLGDQRPLGCFVEHALPLGVGPAMAHDLVAAGATGGEKLRRVLVHRAVDQRRHRQVQRIEDIQQVPGTNPVAPVAPGVVQHVGRRPAGRQLGTQPLAEREVFEIEGKVDGEPLAVGPRIVAPPAQRNVVVAAMRQQVHQQNVASEIPMGYGYTTCEEAAGVARADLGVGGVLTATSAVLPASSAGTDVPRRLAAPVWVTALLIVLAFLVIYPLLMLVFGALSDSNPVVDGFGAFRPSIKHFFSVLGNENVHLAFVNALVACGGGTVLAVVIGVAFSWIVVRTNTPARGFLARATLVPPLVAGVAWGILGSPKTGLLNTTLKWLDIDFRFDFYSMSGLIVVFGIYYAPYVYMFTASALRNMDPSLEEASEVSGASAFTTLFTVTFPLSAPALLAGSPHFF